MAWKRHVIPEPARPLGGRRRLTELETLGTRVIARTGNSLTATAGAGAPTRLSTPGRGEAQSTKRFSRGRTRLPPRLTHERALIPGQNLSANTERLFLAGGCGSGVISAKVKPWLNYAMNLITI